MFHQLRVDSRSLSRFRGLSVIIGLPLLFIIGRFIHSFFPTSGSFAELLELTFLLLLPLFSIIAAVILFSDSEKTRESGLITRPVAPEIWYGSKLFIGLSHIILLSVWLFFIVFLFLYYEKHCDFFLICNFTERYNSFYQLLLFILKQQPDPLLICLFFAAGAFLWVFNKKSPGLICRLSLFLFALWFCLRLNIFIKEYSLSWIRLTDYWFTGLAAAIYAFGLSIFFALWLKKGFEAVLMSVLTAFLSFIIIKSWFPEFKIWVLPGGLGLCFLLSAFALSPFFRESRVCKFKKAAIHFCFGLGALAFFILTAHIKGHIMNLHDTVLGISPETTGADTYFARTIQSPATLFWFPWKLRGYQKIITDRTNYEETIPATGENGKHFFLLSSDRDLWQPRIMVHIYQNENRIARKKGEFSLPFVFFPKDWNWFRYDIQNEINSIWDLGADGSELWTLSAFNADTGQVWLQNEKAQVKTWHPKKNILETLEEQLCFIPTEPDTGIARLDKVPYLFVQKNDSTEISLQKADSTILLTGKKARWLLGGNSFQPGKNTLLGFNGQAINSVYNIPHITVTSIELRNFNLRDGSEKNLVFKDITISARYPQHFFINGVFHGLRYNREHKNYDLLRIDEKGIAEPVYSISTGSDSRSVDKIVLADDNNVIICAKNWYDKPEDYVWLWLDMSGQKIYHLPFNNNIQSLFRQKNNVFEAIFLHQEPGRKSLLARISVGNKSRLVSTTTKPDESTGGEK